MTGSLRKQGKQSWELTIDLGKDDKGKRKRKFVTFRGTKADAQKKLRELITQLDNGMPLDIAKDTVGEFLQQWLETYVKTNTSARTLYGYRGYVRRYLTPKLGRTPLVKLTPKTVQRLYSEMLERGLSARTVLHTHRILKNSLGHAVKWGMVVRNVCAAVDPPKPRRKEMRALDAIEVQRLLESASQSPYRHIFYLAIYTGLRLGELMALKWSDLSIENRTLSVNRSVSRVTGKGFVFTEPKTAKSRRLISLPASTVTLLSSLKAQRKDMWDSVNGVFDESAFIFPSENGTVMAPDRVSHAFNREIKKAGFVEVRFHDLRHTHATLMLKEGIHPKIVSERLGHSSITITMDIYSHVLPGMQETAVEAFEKALQTPMKDVVSI